MDQVEQLLARLQLMQSGTAAEAAPSEQQEQVLSTVDLEGVAEFIKSGKCKKIIVMSGAGVSTAAGIPDFRSPGTGLYDNLQKYNLPSPQSIFEINFFLENPKPFFVLAKELYPGSFRPTLSHYFICLLAEKGLLLRSYTQNIDTLDRVAKVPDDLIVEAHGAFHTAHCTSCSREYTQQWVKDIVFADEIPICENCQGYVKPDIVFFGESLPKRFHTLSMADFKECDLLIVMGTSLAVEPFASLISRVPEKCPRVLINRERVRHQVDSILQMLGIAQGFDFDSSNKYRDVFVGGDCDEGCLKLAALLGWEDKLKQLVASEHAKLPAPPDAKPATTASAMASAMHFCSDIPTGTADKEGQSENDRPAQSKEGKDGPANAGCATESGQAKNLAVKEQTSPSND